jgi:hypothetical protein
LIHDVTAEENVHTRLSEVEEVLVLRGLRVVPHEAAVLSRELAPSKTFLPSGRSIRWAMKWMAPPPNTVLSLRCNHDVHKKDEKVKYDRFIEKDEGEIKRVT